MSGAVMMEMNVQWFIRENGSGDVWDDKLFRGQLSYEDRYINQRDLHFIPCQLLENMHSLNISKIGLFGDSVLRNTFQDAFLSEFNGQYDKVRKVWILCVVP